MDATRCGHVAVGALLDYRYRCLSKQWSNPSSKSILVFQNRPEERKDSIGVPPSEPTGMLSTQCGRLHSTEVGKRVGIVTER